jgi:DmsE family decaheme c-type cytochrome
MTPVRAELQGEMIMGFSRKLAPWMSVAVLCFGGIAVALAEDTPAVSTPAPAATAAPAVADRTLSGDAACTRCHDELEVKPILAMYKTPHGIKADSRTPGCQSCHGASLNHQKNIGGTASRRTLPDVTFGLHAASDAKSQMAACLACHENGKRTLWYGSDHESRDVTCAGCHNIHAPSDPMLNKVTQPEACFACHKPQRSQTHLISTHPVAAGKMTCSDCHNPHGAPGPHLLVKNSVNETCFTCHAEKRGPFLWEHSPVNDDCTNCHTPHGSTITPLLKARVPFLCQECHSGDHAAAINSGANLQDGDVTTVNGLLPLASAGAKAQVAGRACLNCHVLIHGSNHPAGAKYQR